MKTLGFVDVYFFSKQKLVICWIFLGLAHRLQHGKAAHIHNASRS